MLFPNEVRGLDGGRERQNGELDRLGHGQYSDLASKELVLTRQNLESAANISKVNLSGQAQKQTGNLKSVQETSVMYSPT